ncbi:hypothetical protein ACFQVA_01395 [Actinomadura keratinilytica]
MDAVLDAFREVAEGLTYHEPTVPVACDLTGRLAEGDDLRTADYWVRHVRSTVRFADAVRAAHEARHHLPRTGPRRLPVRRRPGHPR